MPQPKRHRVMLTDAKVKFLGPDPTGEFVLAEHARHVTYGQSPPTVTQPDTQRVREVRVTRVSRGF